MLLVLNVGNTNTVIGALEGEEVLHRWRISSAPRTTDELGMLLLQLLAQRAFPVEEVEGVCVACVVPSIRYAVEKASLRYLGQEALVVGSGVRTGLRVRTENPREVGADRIVAALGAVARHGQPVVAVSFGTATTIDCVNAQGDYVGGAIAPGLRISADALFAHGEKLPRVELERPGRAIGGSTAAALQSGLFWGYVGLIDGLVRRCREELSEGGGTRARCVATGEMASLLGEECAEVDVVDDALALHGLRLIFERNPRRSARR